MDLRTLLPWILMIAVGCSPCPDVSDDDDTVADDDDDTGVGDDDDTGVGDDDDTAPWDDPNSWRDLSAGLFHACAIRGDGVLACWGQDTGGQTLPPAGDQWRQVVVGNEHGCALDDTGAITCWGCGGEDPGDEGQCDPPAGTFIHLDAGEANNCAMDGAGALQCWGKNNAGQNDVPDGTVAIDFSTYYGHTCAIHPDRTMTCWGEGLWGQTDVPEDIDFDRVGVSDWTTYAIDTDGVFHCWGRKDCEDAEDRLWKDLSIYTTSVCAVTVNDVPDCFGYNVGERNDEPEGLEGSVVAAGHNFSCAIDLDGEIVCWGCGECPDDPANQGLECGDFGQCDPPAPDEI